MAHIEILNVRGRNSKYEKCGRFIKNGCTSRILGTTSNIVIIKVIGRWRRGRTFQTLTLDVRPRMRG